MYRRESMYLQYLPTVLFVNIIRIIETTQCM